MRSRIFSTLLIVSIAVLGESVMFSADFQFRRHFTSRELPITAKSVGDYGLTALVDVNRVRVRPKRASEWTLRPAEKNSGNLR